MPDLIVERRPFTVHLALAVDGELRRWRILDCLGGIEDGFFRARITALAPDLGGVFATVGDGPDMLVRVASAQRRKLSEGQYLTVLGVRDAMADKPPRATSSLRLDGAWTSWRPGLDGPVADPQLPASLRAALGNRAQALPSELKVVLLAGAAEVDEAALIAEGQKLQAEAAALLHAAESQGSHTGPLDDVGARVRRIVAAWPETDGAPLFVRQHQRLAIARLLQIDDKPIERLTEDPWDEAGLAGARDAALSSRVETSSGAALTFSATPACLAVDVDRARSTLGIQALNREAVDALASHLALAAVGGQIMVDFLDPVGRAGDVDLETALRDALAKLDPAARLVALLPGGIAIIERARRGLSLVERLYAACPACGNGHARPAAWWQLEDALVALATCSDPLARLELAPDLAAVLTQPAYRNAAERWLVETGRTADALVTIDSTAGRWHLQSRASFETG